MQILGARGWGDNSASATYIYLVLTHFKLISDPNSTLKLENLIYRKLQKLKQFVQVIKKLENF